jgi:hypothetical protein
MFIFSKPQLEHAENEVLLPEVDVEEASELNPEKPEYDLILEGGRGLFVSASRCIAVKADCCKYCWCSKGVDRTEAHFL